MNTTQYNRRNFRIIFEDSTRKKLVEIGTIKTKSFYFTFIRIILV